MISHKNNDTRVQLQNIILLWEQCIGIRVKNQNLLVGKTTVVNHENGLFIL